MIKKLNLQLLETVTQTTLLNSTGNDLSPEMKTYYDKQLLRFATPNLVHDQFAQKKNIPANGGKTIEFRKYSQLAKATTALTEGVTPDGQNLNVTAITATIAQYGGFIQMSDLLILTAIDKNLDEAIELLGDQAGRTLDTITREVIVAGTNVIYAGGVVSARNALTSSNKLAVADIARAERKLKVGLAKPFDDGYYVAIIHPDVAFDIKRDSEWIAASNYAGATQVFKGEIGKLYGVRFIETTEAKIWAQASGDSSPKSVYATLVIGKNAYGTTEVEGGGLQTIVKQLGSSGTADPLNQRATAGWKANKTAKILVNENMVRIESESSYSTTDAGAAN